MSYFKQLYEFEQHFDQKQKMIVLHFWSLVIHTII